MKNEIPFVIYVDVDDTLVRSFGTKRIPIVSAIQHVKMLKEQGAVLYCWSSGGVEYAESSAIELGIASCFSGFLPKPMVLIDDQAVAEWRDLVEVGPHGVIPEGVSGYRDLLLKKQPAFRS